MDQQVTAPVSRSTPSPTAPASAPGLLRLLILEMRPRQWTKNLILFAGVIFSKHLLHPHFVMQSTFAVLVFCVLSGIVYTVNDLVDIEADRQHEAKRKRPLASGALPVGAAVAWTTVMLVGALVAAAFIGTRFLFISALFLGFNLAYSLYLKNVVIVDVLSISISFLIRAIAGVVALHNLGREITISPWLLVVTFFLSFFLGLCKRRHEFLLLQQGSRHRPTLAAYSTDLLNQLINMAATATLIAYSIYTIWPTTVEQFQTGGLMYTIPIVTAGVTRYLFLVYRRNLGGDPSEMLLTQRSLWAVILAWLVVVVFTLYFKP